MLGPNGSGKTTLDPAAARPDPPHGGHGGAARPPDADRRGDRAAARRRARRGARASTRSCPGGRTCGGSRRPSRCCRRGRSRQPWTPRSSASGSGDAADRRFRGYSLGMKQRLGLAGALLLPRRLVDPRRADERPGPRRHPRRPRDHRRAARGRRDGRRVVAPAHRGRGHLHARRRAPVGLADRRGRAAPPARRGRDAGSSSRPRTPISRWRRCARPALDAYRDDAPTSPPSSCPTGDAPEVIALLVRAGVAVHEARRRRPRLEELFARLTERATVSENPAP